MIYAYPTSLNYNIISTINQFIYDKTLLIILAVSSQDNDVILTSCRIVTSKDNKDSDVIYLKSR